MLKVGLTGNYGMGKSMVLGIMADLGAPTISADSIVATLHQDPKVLAGIRDIFGDMVLDQEGTLNKPFVAKIIFRDRGLRKRLEDYMHPLVFERIDKEMAAMPNARVVVAEVPLLFECQAQGRFHKTITVYTDFPTVIKRMEARGIKRDDVLTRTSAQMPAQDKVRMADYKIDNNGPREETLEQCRKVYAELLELAK